MIVLPHCQFKFCLVQSLCIVFMNGAIRTICNRKFELYLFAALVCKPLLCESICTLVPSILVPLKLFSVGPIACLVFFKGSELIDEFLEAVDEPGGSIPDLLPHYVPTKPNEGVLKMRGKVREGVNSKC